MTEYDVFWCKPAPPRASFCQRWLSSETKYVLRIAWPLVSLQTALIIIANRIF